MTKHPLALAIAFLMLSISGLSGCDQTSRLTEQEHIQRAKDFEDQNNYKGSVIELKNAILKNPDSAEARLLLGQIYLKTGNGAEAEKELTRARQLGVGNEAITPYLGQALLLMGEFQRVLDEIEAGQHSSKANLAKILQLRADALLGLGKTQEGCNLYQQSLEADTENPGTYWGLARCAIAERNHPQARAWLGQALETKKQLAQTWVVLGDLEQFERKPEAALLAYTKALEIAPQNFAALESRATINANLGKLEAARKDVETVRQHFPRSLAAHHLQALLKFREKKYPEARDSLQAALRIAPDHPRLLLLGGLIETALGNPQTAESHFSKAARGMPHNSFVLRMLAGTQLRLGRVEDAAKTLAPIDLEKTRDGGLFAIAGEIAAARGDFATATEYFEKAALRSPENPEIRTELGVARLALGDRQALADLEAAAAMQGAGTRPDIVIIATHLKQKQYDAALARIASLEKKQLDSPIPWNYRGAAYLGKRDLKQARASFEQALRIDPAFYPAAANLANLDLADKRPDMARSRYEGVLKATPSHLQAMLALAELSLQDKNEKASLAWLEKAAKAHPSAVLPRERMVRHFLRQGDKRRAIDIAQDIVSSNPESPEAMNLLGATQLAVGDTQGAINTLSAMAKKVPQSADALQRLALAYIAARQTKQAQATLQSALQLRPDHLPSQRALIQLELERKNANAALKIAREMQTQRPAAPQGYLLEGDVLMHQKDFNAAAKAYAQARERGSQDISTVRQYQALRAAEQREAADNVLRDALARYPQEQNIREFVASEFLAAGRNKEAISLYADLVERNPQNLVALNNLANLYFREGDKRAWPVAERALQLAPDNPTVQDTAGWILLGQNQMARGLDLINKAAKGAPNNATIRYHHAAALAQAGDKTQAKKELTRLLADTPSFPDSDQARALLDRL